jgi:hypothetical protein
MDRGADMNIKDDEVSINDIFSENAFINISFACNIYMNAWFKISVMN